MRRIVSSSRPHYVAKVWTLLIIVSLIAGTVGCTADGGVGVSHDLTMAVAPTGSGTASDLDGDSPYAAGTAVSIKAVANQGYEFAGWTAPAGGFSDASAAETTFTMPDQDVTVTANFAHGGGVTKYSLTMAVAPGGSGMASDLTGASPYEAGTAVSIKAVANQDYQFVSWTAPAGGFSDASAAQTTFTMPAQGVTVTANFEPIPQLLIYEDDFSDGTSGWEWGSSQNYEYGYEDGEYYILVKNADWSVWSWKTRGLPFTDFALEIDARLVSGPTESSYGVIFHLQKEVGFYSFNVMANGYYYLRKRFDGEWVTLQGLTRSDFVNEGNSTNHLRVVCRGTQIQVYVNGYHLATVTDDSLPDGYVGMIADASGPDTRVAFDNIRIYSLD